MEKFARVWYTMSRITSLPSDERCLECGRSGAHCRYDKGIPCRQALSTLFLPSVHRGYTHCVAAEGSLVVLSHLVLEPNADLVSLSDERHEPLGLHLVFKTSQDQSPLGRSCFPKLSSECTVTQLRTKLR